MEKLKRKQILNRVVFTTLILFWSTNSYSAIAFEIGGRRTYLNYVLPDNLSFSTNLGTAYNLGFVYKLSDIQDIRFKYETSKYLLNIPATMTGQSKIKEEKFELLYSHKLGNFRPYFAIGEGNASFLNVSGTDIQIQDAGGTYGLIGLEMIGVLSAWATSSVGIDLLTASSQTTFSGYGKLRAQEGLLYVETYGGYSTTNLEKNSVDQRLDQISLGINIGKAF